MINFGITQSQIDLNKTAWGEKFQTKIRVLLVYIIYPMAIATYFKKALQHREDVDLRVAGPYTSNWIPWKGGMTVDMKYAIPPDLPLPFPPNIGEINYDIIKAQLGDWTPDIIINIDAGLHFKYKPVDGYVVTVGTDPHVLNDWYEGPRGYSDKFFNMQLCYSREKDIYLPYAYSQYDHYPNELYLWDDGTEGYAIRTPNNIGLEVTESPKDTDAVMIGMPYDNRVQWVNELRKRGVSVIFENGPIFDEARELYNRGRIGLNWSSMNDTNARVFELAAMRLAPVLNETPDLWKFFNRGFHSLGFTTLNEAIEQVMWFMNHPDDVIVYANRAYNAVQGQTYDARIQQILEESGFA